MGRMGMGRWSWRIGAMLCRTYACIVLSVLSFTVLLGLALNIFVGRRSL